MKTKKPKKISFEECIPFIICIMGLLTFLLGTFFDGGPLSKLSILGLLMMITGWIMSLEEKIKNLEND